MTDHTLPLKGGWIMIKRKLPTTIQVPLLSIFYAIPDRLFPMGWHTAAGPIIAKEDEAHLALLWRYRHSRQKMLGPEQEQAKKLDDKGIRLDQRVRIIAPDGEVWIEPYEWLAIPDIQVYLDMVDGDHVKLHTLTTKTDGKLSDQVHYLRSRGIPKIEAYSLLFGTVSRRDVFWIEVHPGYASFFGLDEPRPRKRTLLTPMKVEIEHRA